MAISVDRVYQTVLALANKEQRGYITPQEFNLFANHAQNEIFEQYFYDLNQQRRLPGNSTIISDAEDILEEKIGIHRRQGEDEYSIGQSPQDEYEGVITLNNVYKLETLRVRYPNHYGVGTVTAERLEPKDFYERRQTSLLSPSRQRPVYVVEQSSITSTQHTFNIKICPFTEDSVAVPQLIQRPPAPNWTYVVVNDRPLWNASATDRQDFILHDSEEKNLVIKILQLASVAIKDYNLAQAAGSKEGQSIQQEKA
jgi:hypothetical protein